MDLKDLIAISGYPGLFRFITQGRNAIIVESLEDKKRISAYSTSRMSTLEEIAVFTETEEIPLAEVLKRMFRHSDGKEALPHKSPNEEIKKYFEEVLPEYDRERVYVSDMKKIIHWYNLLVKYDLLNSETVETGNEDEGPDTESEEEKPAADSKAVAPPVKKESFSQSKPGGSAGGAGMTSRNQTGKAIRMPRKT
ncbi:MAG: DUF5606 domain-containing protein [Bacteroidales bacterium]